MKRVGTAFAMSLAFGLSACEGRGEVATEAEGSEAVAAVTEGEPALAPPAAEPSTLDQSTGLPSFAELFPGADLEAPMTMASGPAGAGGMATFTTSAAPEDVVAFYRERAEKAGLAPVMAMNQGEARAYSAAARSPSGPSLQVVASPGEAGVTSVQLSWSAGA